MVGTAGGQELTSALLDRARRLREAAFDLEALAGAHDPRPVGPPDWARTLHGDWRALRSDAGSIARSRSSSAVAVASAAATEAITSALTGDRSAARTAAVRAESIAPDDEHVITGVGLARAIDWFGQGEFALSCSTALVSLERVDGGRSAAALIGVLAESAARCHQEDRARAALHRSPGLSSTDGAALQEVLLAEAVLDRRSPSDAMLALLSDGSLTSQFARSRLQLMLGVWFRRHHLPTDARRVLTISLDNFVEMGAQPWIPSARNELRATGVRQPDTGHQALSRQQVLIATMAARGLTNREIAAQLFLSPRTVASHLYRIFPKLGITTRGQLATGLTLRTRSTDTEGDQDDRPW